MQLSNGDKVVKMQNPWGSEKFTGRYSDDSSLWTAALRSEAGQSTRNDGVFFMHFDDYWNQCSETYISYDVRGWSSDAYLYLDDNSQA